MTPDQPLVSILIPCHNAERFLADTLASALAQTWPHKEIIVVDDGSTDGSLAVARTYAAAGVHCVRQEARGASSARNHAFRLSHGTLIQFLDADDLLAPDKIARQVDTLRRHPTGVVASGTWGRFLTDPASAVFTPTGLERDLDALTFLERCALEGVMMHPSAWLCPRHVLEAAGPWNETLTLNDDGEFFCRVVLASRGIAFASGAVSYYRSGLPGSLSQRRDERSRRSQLHSIVLMDRHILAVENSPRRRQTVAAFYRRFIYDFYPAPADAMQRAHARIHALGGRLSPPPMGPKTRLAARLLGWRNVWRLRHLLATFGARRRS